MSEPAASRTALASPDCAPRASASKRTPACAAWLAWCQRQPCQPAKPIATAAMTATMSVPCCCHQVFSSASCSCSSRSSAIEGFLYCLDEPAERMLARRLRQKILHLHHLLRQLILPGDHRHAEALAVGIGELVLQLRRLEVDLGVDPRLAQRARH